MTGILRGGPCGRYGPGLLLVLVMALAACGGDEHKFERPDQAAAADSLFSPEMFDTIAWSSDSLRVLRGNEVYAAECQQCHGYLGRGDTEYARSRDLDVPSLVRSDWEFAGDLRGALREIFTGHGEGMPSWGVGRLTPRQIESATYYVIYQIRPDVLGDTTSAVP